MIKIFTSFIASIRYLFVFAVLALAALALGSLGRGVMELVNLAIGSGFEMAPGSGALVVPYFIRAAFLYFLASALCSLFVGEPPVPQWMQVKNLFQFRVKVLAFVAIILPLAFMGRVMSADLAGQETFYSGAGVFLVMLGIFFLIRFGPTSGDESLAREGTRVPEDSPRQDQPRPERQDRRPRPNKESGRKDSGRKDSGPRDSGRKDRSPDRSTGQETSAPKGDDWLEKQKESLKFQKDSLSQVADTGSKGEGETRQNGNVTVRPGPRRPRRRR